MRTWICVVGLLAACGKPSEKKQQEPAKTVEHAPARVPLTSKSPEAIKELEAARDAADYGRPGALEHAQKAVALDPEFAQALAFAGLLTPGAEGTAMIGKAVALAAKLPESERAQIDAYQAQRTGDGPRLTRALEKIVELAPGQYEAEIFLARIANDRFDPTSAIKHSEHVLTIAPNNAVTYNSLAYAYALQREWDKAITAAKKQTELLPKEANPLDTLGEIQLWAGKFGDAEQSFVAATKLDPNFVVAWNGAALARAYQGNFAGAYEAFKHQETSTQPGAKYQAMLDRAWIEFSEDKLPTAMATLDALDKDPDAPKFPLYAYSSLDRGHMLSLAGKPADAAKWYATTLTRVNGLTGGAKNGVLMGYRIGVLRDAALQGKPAADAEKLVAEAEAFAKDRADDQQAQSTLAHVRGLAVWAKSGARAGADELVKCSPRSVMCRYDLVIASKQAGDADGTKAIREELADTPVRIPEGVYIKTHPVQ